MKKHNFSAGPSILPKDVFTKSSKSVLELDNIGLSVLEISHRSKEFVSIMENARSLAIELLGLNSEEYTTLFLQGGASMQFLMVAYNFLEKKASYIDTGAWSTKAIKEAKLFGEVDVLASSKDSNFNYIPKDYDIPTESDYLHITTNNTIFGTQFSGAPDTDCHVFADMSSDIFSRNIDYSKFSPDFSNKGCNHCCVSSSVVAVKVIQTATKINNGVNNDLILFDVSVSIFSDFGNNALKNM